MTATDFPGFRVWMLPWWRWVIYAILQFLIDLISSLIGDDYDAVDEEEIDEASARVTDDVEVDGHDDQDHWKMYTPPPTGLEHGIW